ncbi:MAG: pentapeptide repeat-containing protein [Nodosilinea sp.]
MANEQHLSILKQGVEIWNQWRKENPHVIPDLCGIKFRFARLSGINFSRTNLAESDFSGAHLIGANLTSAKLLKSTHIGADLSAAQFINTIAIGANLSRATFIQADLSRAMLSTANLSRADLRGANLTEANLFKAKLTSANLKWANFARGNLGRADFSWADISQADLRRANLPSANFVRANLSEAHLTSANLSSANLRGADCSWADLSRVNFSHSNLSDVNFSLAQALETDFTMANLTGACLADWHIGSSTNLDKVVCAYFFRTLDEDSRFSGRLPRDPSSIFNAGEFELWASVRASALETIDLTFTEGFKWQYFFDSLQEVRWQNPDTGIFLQGVEERNGQYVVHLRIETDKTGDDRAILEAKIETTTKELIEVKRQLYEAHGEIRALDRRLDRSLEEALRMATDQGPKYNLQGAQFAGGFAETVQGNQIGGVINNYRSNADDIVRLLFSLGELSQAFPEDQQQQVQIHLQDLAIDLKQPEQCSPTKLKTRLAGLFGVLILLGGGIATATDFANNVLELSEKLNVPAKEFQPQLQQFKQIYPDFDWQS